MYIYLIDNYLIWDKSVLGGDFIFKKCIIANIYWIPTKGRMLRTGPVFTLLILKATRFLFSKKNNLSTKMQLTNLPKFQQLAQIEEESGLRW